MPVSTSTAVPANSPKGLLTKCLIPIIILEGRGLVLYKNFGFAVSELDIIGKNHGQSLEYVLGNKPYASRSLKDEQVTPCRRLH